MKFNKMKNLFRLVFLVVFVLLSYDVLAIVARPTTKSYKLPDGTSIDVRLHGDEHFNWTTTADGYRLVQNSEGYFVYVSSLKSGSVVPSEIRASDIDKRTIEELKFVNLVGKNIGVREQVALYKQNKSRLKSSVSDFPSTGTPKKSLLILATFNDKSPTFTQTDFDNLMNYKYKKKGSFRDFYLENSNGNFDITTTVTVWVTVPNSYAYYSPDTKWAEFAFDAIKAADPLVDYSQFEKNGSNLYGVTIIHQGMGQETSQNPNDIWSHQGELAYYKPSALSRTFDGVVLNSYSMQPEIYDPGKITGLGIIAHEFGHLLGLPDFYDTDYEQSGGNFDGTGSWDLMASGAYNGSYDPATPNALDAASPAHNNPISKEFLGWITPAVLNSAQQITLNPIISSQTVYKIKTSTPKEFFYLENRQQLGFDTYLPGHGMLVYHVDSSWINTHSSTNDINVGSHQGLYVKVAAGTSINASGTPFPGAGYNKNVTDNTTPNLDSWLGVPTSKSITNISEDASGVITFDFMSIQSGSPQSFDSKNVYATQNNLTWLSSLTSAPVLIAYSEAPQFGTPDNGVNYPVDDPLPGGGKVIFNGSGTSFSHTGLNVNTTHYYKIWSNNSLTYSPPLYAQSYTHVPITIFPWLDPILDPLNNWSSFWLNGSFIEWKSDVIDGDVTVASIYQSGSGSASAIMVSKPIIADTGKDYILSFNHIQPAYSSDQDSVSVMIKSVLSETWTHLKTYNSDMPNWNYQEVNLPKFAEPFQIGFSGFCKNGYGIALDSIKISEGSPIINKDLTISIKSGFTPISGAEVNFMGRKVYSDSQGDAIFSNIFPSKNWELITVKATGFENATAKVKPYIISLYQIGLIESEAIAPTNFTASVDYNSVSLNWNPVIDESFEGYAPWDTANITGWTLRDFDKGLSGSFRAFNYPNEDSKSAFVVFDGSYGGINPNFTPHSGSQMAVSFYSQNMPNNDWMISPNILVSDGDYLEFYAKSADVVNAGFESMKVFISESTIDTISFVPIQTVSSVPGVWTKYSSDLTIYKGKRIHFAIQCNSIDKYALLIDDVKVKNINTVNNTPQAPVPDSHTSVPDVYGNIEYQLLRNGFIINTLNGFSKSSFADIVTCSDLDYSIQTNYISPERKSTSVSNISLSTCRVVTVNVKESGIPIVGATVSLSGVLLTTNSQGMVVFDKVSDSNHPFSITFTGFSSINETLAIVSDTVINKEISPTVIIPDKPFENVKIKPNPNNGSFIISNTDLPVPFNYSIYSMDGQLLFSGTVVWMGDTKVDLDLPANSTYLLKLFVGDKVLTHKIVVIK